MRAPFGPIDKLYNQIGNVNRLHNIIEPFAALVWSYRVHWVAIGCTLLPVFGHCPVQQQCTLPNQTMLSLVRLVSFSTEESHTEKSNIPPLLPKYICILRLTHLVQYSWTIKSSIQSPSLLWKTLTKKVERWEYQLIPSVFSQLIGSILVCLSSLLSVYPVWPTTVLSPPHLIQSVLSLSCLSSAYSVWPTTVLSPPQLIKSVLSLSSLSSAYSVCSELIQSFLSLELIQSALSLSSMS